MKLLNYRILLRKEPEGGYTVVVPTLQAVLPMEILLMRQSKWQKKKLSGRI